MAPAPQGSDVNKLSLNSSTTTPAKKASKKVVADSWEDEDLSESEPDTESRVDGKDDDEGREEQPSAPPPTPMSPIGTSWSSASGSPSSRTPEEASRRPEKTDAVARRMIAASLGLKVPKQTEEQRAFQKSIREQEKKRREQEKAAEQKAREDAQKAKAAIWDD
ncbi:hypothetical protein BGZ63DRAFT_403043 [Mariannaea sp. PMI_226]|nr:hypothetical protein BGZ63DRAFT_403043 [Mariannaea sp. PMI_226]